MSKVLATAIPILKGKTEQWKKFADELKTRYKKEFNESRKKLGVREHTFLQSSPAGDMAIVVLKGENPEAAFQKLGEGTDEFTKWFNSQTKEIHGMDLTKKAEFAIPQLVIETEPIEEPVHH